MIIMIVSNNRNEANLYRSDVEFSWRRSQRLTSHVDVEFLLRRRRRILSLISHFSRQLLKRSAYLNAVFYFFIIFYCGPNYRPISNMSIVSKVPERPVLARLRPHLLGCANFSQFQSAYRKGHSTETADDKHVTFLIGLDLFAAFQWHN